MLYSWGKTYLLDTLYPKHLYVSNGMPYLWTIHEDFLHHAKNVKSAAGRLLAPSKESIFNKYTL